MYGDPNCMATWVALFRDWESHHSRLEVSTITYIFSLVFGESMLFPT